LRNPAVQWEIGIVRRAGFTLIEILIVVGIIAIMLASAVMSVASGRGAVKVKEATRGVVQLSRYASALALLRQRPVVITFHRKGRVEVRISGEATGSGEVGKPSDPIYLEVNGETTRTAAEIAAEAGEEGETGGYSSSGSTGASEKEKKGFFYTRQALNPEELAKEDAESEYDGIEIKVEVLGEDGEPLPPEIAASLSLKQPERKKPVVDVFNSLDINREDEEGKAFEDENDEAPVSVTYETNGNVNPHRIIIRLKDASATDEGFAINVSRSGKATVGEDDEDDRRGKKNVRRRR
jgi:prepilin-type N-terminal cleavage/methylation domain-containing protein